jgi:hypothetical protein
MHDSYPQPPHSVRAELVKAFLNLKHPSILRRAQDERHSGRTEKNRKKTVSRLRILRVNFIRYLSRNSIPSIMALGATVYVFEIRLADADRNVYETLSLRVARHPSESEEYLLTRVLAYCLEFTEGIAFSSGGLSNPDEPALAIRDLTGALQSWIEIGAPEATRLHKASKAATHSS